MTKEKTKQLVVRISPDLHTKAMEKSQRTGRSIAHVVRTALEARVDEADDKATHQKQIAEAVLAQLRRSMALLAYSH